MKRLFAAALLLLAVPINTQITHLKWIIRWMQRVFLSVVIFT